MFILQRARWHLAALSVRTALARTCLALLRAYDPNQPRVPAGSSEGGRWTDGDAGFDPGFAPDDAELVGIADDGDRRYTVVLSEDEGRGGGHTLRDHVGKTDAELMGRVQASRGWTPFHVYGRQRHGSFASPEVANDLVNRALEQNADKVDLVLSGSEDGYFIKHRFGYIIGREAYTNGRVEPYLRNTYGVGILIMRDSGSKRGYRVHTAYPRNDGD
ncbi:RNase A-like domain-containing protein [Methylorubrum sp. SB2]|uniref:RNase A-like domain-containing protein n=1 Tax=Methylorubrum subtropicum TaxID=3138812 RepID=UPI00313F31AB